MRPRPSPPALHTFVGIIAGLFLALSANAHGAPDEPVWPEFRGPHRSGVASPDRPDAFPVSFGPRTNLAWSVPTPAGHASPVVSGDTLFLAAFESNRLQVVALNRADGRERWRQSLEPGRIESGTRLSHPASATPATDGERLIAYFAPFGLIAFDLAGRELWRHPMPTPVTQHGASSSPTLAGNLVLQLCDQDVASYLIALDKLTGKVAWKTDRDAFRRGFSTALPYPPDRPEIAVVAGTLRLVAYDLATGRERWSVRGLPNEMVSSPIAVPMPAPESVSDAGSERILVAGWTYGSGVARMPTWESVLAPGDAHGDGRLSRDEAPNGPAKQHFTYIDADKDGVLTRDEYETIARIFNESKNAVMTLRPGGQGDVTDTHVDWKQTRGLPYCPTPLAYRGRIYLVRNGGLFSCLDAATGAYRFQEERLGALGDYYASPVAGGGKILVISQAGVAVVLRAADTLEVLARNELGEQVLATPALVDGTLYVRTASRLHAFREGALPRQP